MFHFSLYTFASELAIFTFQFCSNRRAESKANCTRFVLLLLVFETSFSWRLFKWSWFCRSLTVSAWWKPRLILTFEQISLIVMRRSYSITFPYLLRYLLALRLSLDVADATRFERIDVHWKTIYATQTLAFFTTFHPQTVVAACAKFQWVFCSQQLKTQ